MTSEELFTRFESGFARRHYSAGLLMSFIDFLIILETPTLGLVNLEDFYKAFPRRYVTQAGGQANTLIVEFNDGTLSIRKFYNAVETLIRAEHHRFDYPSCAPHATQAWEQYSEWLESLVTFNDSGLRSLRQRVLDFVLSNFPDQQFDPANARREPPLFRYILDGFDLTAHAGEKSGAAYQGIVFGFLRADNPHLQVEIRKVRTGSARKKGIGDIDCWDGGSLAISAEVKQYEVSSFEMFAGFANEISRRGTLGMVVAIDFITDDVRDAIEDLGVRALTQNDLLRIAELWDPIKQRTAVRSLFYYIDQVEQNSALSVRLRTYLEEQKGHQAVDFY